MPRRPAQPDPIPTPPIVIVTWGDAWFNIGTNWSLPITTQNYTRIISVGWLLRDDEAGVTICEEYRPKIPHDQDENARNVKFVPRGMILGVEIVRK